MRITIYRKLSFCIFIVLFIFLFYSSYNDIEVDIVPIPILKDNEKDKEKVVWDERKMNSWIDIPSWCAKWEEKEKVDNKHLYINIASGTTDFGKLWHNYDKPGYKRQKKNIIPIDLVTKDPLPGKTNESKIIMAIFVVEHLIDEEIMHLFRESFRMLRSGGIFRIGVPDIEVERDALLRNDRIFLGWHGIFARKNPNIMHIEYAFLLHFCAACWRQLVINGNVTYTDIHKTFSELPVIEACDYYIHQTKNLRDIVDWAPEHRNCLSFKKLYRMLFEVGFRDISRMTHQQSRCKIINDHYDTRFLHKGAWAYSLYVESQKP